MVLIKKNDSEKKTKNNNLLYLKNKKINKKKSKMACFLRNSPNENVKVSFLAKKKHIIIPQATFIQNGNDFKWDDTTGTITYSGPKKLFIFNFNFIYDMNETLTHDLCIDGKSQELNADYGFTVASLKKGSIISIEAHTSQNLTCTYSTIFLAISKF